MYYMNFFIYQYYTKIFLHLIGISFLMSQSILTERKKKAVRLIRIITFDYTANPTTF